jgi:DCN1-like protein 1/2
MQLCSDVGIEPTQLEFLLLSYQLNAERMGEFTRDGFIKGCEGIQADSIEKLKNAIPMLLNQWKQDELYFKKIYQYAFLMGRQAGQKSLCNVFYHCVV